MQQQKQLQECFLQNLMYQRKKQKESMLKMVKKTLVRNDQLLHN